MKNKKHEPEHRIAILATDGFEQSELLEPKKALEAAGHHTEIISLKAGKIRGWDEKDWGKPLPVDRTIDSVSADDYTALVLPGGVMNPDKLRRNPDVLNFVKKFFAQLKPVAAICHGPWTLIDAEVVKGYKLTSYPSIQSDLKNAGAFWTDAPVVVDRNLITSRKPADLPQFNQQLLKAIDQILHPAGFAPAPHPLY